MPWPAFLIVQTNVHVGTTQGSGRFETRIEAWCCLLSNLNRVLAAEIVKTAACEQVKRSCVG